MNRLLGTLEGVVSDSSGRAVADAAVMLGEGPEHPDIAAVTGASGEFRFGELQPGDYEVIVNSSGEPTRARTRVEAGRVTRVRLTVE